MPLELINKDRLNKFLNELKKWLPRHYADKDTTETALGTKASKSEMSVTPGTGADADKTTIQLKSGTSVTVLTTHQDISGKQDTLAFDGTYDASTNKVATVSTVTSAVSGLSGCAVSYNSSTGELHLDFSPQVNTGGN